MYEMKFQYLSTDGTTVSDVKKKVRLPESAEAPIKKGEKAGEISYEQNGKLLGSVDILYKNTNLYPACAKIINYCKVNSPVYYTPALQLIEEIQTDNWRSRIILRAILCTSLDTLYKQWYNLHVNKVLR